MADVFRLGSMQIADKLAEILIDGKIVTLDNGPTGALVCKKSGPLYDFKDRPSEQALSAWGDQHYYWSYRDKSYYKDNVVSMAIDSGVLEGKTFLRFKVPPFYWLIPGMPKSAVSRGMLQIYSSPPQNAFLIRLQKRLLKNLRQKYIYVTSTNKRGLRPARGEKGLIDWAGAFDLPLFLLPYSVRDEFDVLPKESFPIIEAQPHSFVIRRRGWFDVETFLRNVGLPVKEELDTK